MRLAVFCKSFREDFGRLGNLIDSHRLFNPSIPLIISVPHTEVELCNSMAPVGGGVQIICDEDYAPRDMAGMHGWYQQQICKLSIHRSNLADAYFSIDSDAYFVRPVETNDFFHGERPRIVFSNLFTKYSPWNSNLLKYIIDSRYTPNDVIVPGSLDGFASRLEDFRHWLSLTTSSQPIKRAAWINRLFAVPEGTALQPGQILHATLLAAMEKFFLSYGIDLVELIKLIPWEYNWYGSWASAALSNEVALSTSPILHFASDEDVAHARQHGVTQENLAARFKAVQMAARHFDGIFF
jgi:hypothetical protein